MLADFYIPRFSNDMKIDVQKNHLWGEIELKFQNRVSFVKRSTNFKIGINLPFTACFMIPSFLNVTKQNDLFVPVDLSTGRSTVSTSPNWQK